MGTTRFKTSGLTSELFLILVQTSIINGGLIFGKQGTPDSEHCGIDG